MEHSFSITLLKTLTGLFLLFSVLAVVLLLFSSRIGNLEERRNALLLAGQVFSLEGFEQRTEVGVFDTTAVMGGDVFQIRRIVRQLPGNIREVTVYIEKDGRRDIQLSRRFYHEERH